MTKTSLAQHIARHVIDHLCEQRHAILRAKNYVLWTATYGPTVADKINKICSEHWSKKGWKGVPFHPLLVSLFRNETIGEPKCPSIS